MTSFWILMLFFGGLVAMVVAVSQRLADDPQRRHRDRHSSDLRGMRTSGGTSSMDLLGVMTTGAVFSALAEPVAAARIDSDPWELSDSGSPDWLDGPRTEINPATGLPMVGGIGGLDVMGNPWGVDLHSSDDLYDHTGFASSSAFDDELLGMGSGAGLGDSFSSSFDSFDHSSSFGGGFD